MGSDNSKSDKQPLLENEEKVRSWMCDNDRYAAQQKRICEYKKESKTEKIRYDKNKSFLHSYNYVKFKQEKSFQKSNDKSKQKKTNKQGYQRL